MKQLICGSLLFLLVNSAYSQAGLEVNISTNWSYFRASSNLSNDEVYSLYMMESPLFSVSGDIFYRKIFKNKWLFKGGLGFQDIGYHFESAVNTTFKETGLYRHLTASFLGGYHYQKEKWSAELFTGVKPSYMLLSEKSIQGISTIQDGIQNSSLEPVSSWNISTLLGFQINYSVTQKSDITIGMNTEVYLNLLEESIFYKKRYNLTGVKLGYIYYW